MKVLFTRKSYENVCSLRWMRIAWGRGESERPSTRCVYAEIKRNENDFVFVSSYLIAAHYHLTQNHSFLSFPSAAWGCVRSFRHFCLQFLLHIYVSCSVSFSVLCVCVRCVFAYSRIVIIFRSFVRFAWSSFRLSYPVIQLPSTHTLTLFPFTNPSISVRLFLYIFLIFFFLRGNLS